MRFRQIDKITELIPWERIVATRQVHAGEDYLRDHFPLFKVMPGVLMLESLFQASCWLIRASENFEHAVLTLQEVRNAKFADFMQPGQTLTITCEVHKVEENTITMKASGTKDDTVAVSARLIIAKANLDSQQPDLAALDSFMRHSMRQVFHELTDGKIAIAGSSEVARV
jgi:3-hydroxyacyl-[acyl-carrier-protein] dehydratase